MRSIIRKVNESRRAGLASSPDLTTSPSPILIFECASSVNTGAGVGIVSMCLWLA